MAKIINLNVYDAKNVICVWNENEPNDDFIYGIALKDAVRGFMVPRYIIVAVFDDGSTKAAGIFSYEEINHTEEDGDMFLYNEFCYCVGLYAAKAFVRLKLAESTSDLKKAKDEVYAELLESGVEINEEARQYLTE